MILVMDQCGYNPEAGTSLCLVVGVSGKPRRQQKGCLAAICSMPGSGSHALPQSGKVKPLMGDKKGIV